MCVVANLPGRCSSDHYATQCHTLAADRQLTVLLQQQQQRVCKHADLTDTHTGLGCDRASAGVSQVQEAVPSPALSAAPYTLASAAAMPRAL